MRSLLRVTGATAVIATLLTLLLSAVSCVPKTTDEVDPRGAFLLQVGPSAGSRGEPFVTSDGWTIHVDAFVLQIFAEATNVTGDYQVYGQPEQSDVLFSAATPVTLQTNVIPEGPVNLLIGYSIKNLFADDDPVLNNQGVDPTLAARFLRAPDIDTFGSVPNADFAAFAGPCVSITAHAEKEGRTVTIDLTLQDPFPIDPAGLNAAHTLQTTIVRDSLVNVPATVMVENLFRDDAVPNSGPLIFNEFADADADGNGLLTAEELVHTPRPCPACEADDISELTLAASLSRRLNNVFVPPSPSSP